MNRGIVSAYPGRDLVHRERVGSLNIIDRYCRSRLLRTLSPLRYGCITLVDGVGVHSIGNDTGVDTASRLAPIKAALIVDDPRFYRLLAINGTVGFGEAYFLGYWHSEQMMPLLQLLARNLSVLAPIGRGVGGLARVRGALRGLLLDRNTLEGSRRNIARHYDLGNDFFALFLDPTLNYSAALFESPEATLEDASRAKMEMACRALELDTDDHLLEIGSGWGGLAIHAARNYGCRVTTTTISQEQYRYTCERVAQEGLGDRITVLNEDYRHLRAAVPEQGFDKLVAIEMIEAVGHDYIASYLRRCSELLKSDGLMLIQSITIDEQRHAAATSNVDFIQRYIFPGGSLPSIASLVTMMGKATPMRLLTISDLTQDYALTLERWREAFNRREDEVAALGYDLSFIRMWRYYLAYSEAAFREQVVGCKQLLLANPDYRPPSLASAT